MKFGKQFESYKIPEWSEYYFDYQGIKTVLKFIDKRVSKKKKVKKLQKLQKKLRRHYSYASLDNNEDNRKSTLEQNLLNKNVEKILVPVKKQELHRDLNKIKKILEAEDLSNYPDDVKAQKMLQIYRNSIKIVDNFFLEKLMAYEQSLNNLDIKMKETTNKVFKNNYKKKYIPINSELDQMGYAVSWRRALSKLYTETSWLHSYHSINILAIKKIEKKISKVFKFLGIDIKKDLENVETEFPFFGESLKIIVELRRKIKKVYSEEFTNNDIKKASKELSQNLRGSTKKSESGLIYFALGLVLSCILFLIILAFMDGDNGKSIKPYFPAYNFGLILILAFVGAGVVIHILKSFKINYIYLLDIVPGAKISEYDLFKASIFLLTFWLIALSMTRLALNFGYFGEEFVLFGLIFNGSLIIILFLPINIFYYSFRKGIFHLFFRSITPFGKSGVHFRDFVFGDVLCSLNKPFTSLLLSFCLISCRQCGLKNERLQGCSRETIPCAIVLCFPFVIRFSQCVNKFYYTNQKLHHFGNMVKYTCAFTNNLIGWFHSKYSDDNFYTYFHYIMETITQSYEVFWDIKEDWGLGHIHSKNFFLRDKLTYPKFYYYMAMFLDTFFRFHWTWNFIKIDDSWSEWKNCFYAIVEVYRRSQWAVFRMDNEYLCNPENYRTILAIPDLPED